MAKTTLTLDVEYDDHVTDPEALASAADRLLETALSTPGILDDYANPRFGEFYVQPAGRRWVLYDLDSDALVGTRVYNEHAEAVEDAAQANDILVLPLVIPGRRPLNQGEDPDNE